MPYNDVPHTTRVAPDAPLTIGDRPKPEIQAIPTSSAVRSYVDDSPDDEKIPALTVSFTVTPKSGHLDGIDLMEAIIRSVHDLGGDLENLSIRKDSQKK